MRSLRRVDHSSRGVLPEVVCDGEFWTVRKLWPTRGLSRHGKNILNRDIILKFILTITRVELGYNDLGLCDTTSVAS